jgi:hypothetical protein
MNCKNSKYKYDANAQETLSGNLEEDIWKEGNITLKIFLKKFFFRM